MVLAPLRDPLERAIEPASRGPLLQHPAPRPAPRPQMQEPEEVERPRVASPEARRAEPNQPGFRWVKGQAVLRQSLRRSRPGPSSRRPPEKTRSRSRPHTARARLPRAGGAGRRSRTTCRSPRVDRRSPAAARSLLPAGCQPPGSSRPRSPARPPSTTCRSRGGSLSRAPCRRGSSGDGRDPVNRRTPGCPPPVPITPCPAATRSRTRLNA